jgi:two-component system, NarL family, nitrate/nitrite response regulator NarL
MSKIRILLIEDNRFLRVGLTAMLNGQIDMRVVASSDGHEKTLLRAQKTKADVILVDLSGFRIVSSLVKENPEFKVIGMGLIPAQHDIVEFVQAGASGFIMKDASVDDVLMTIRVVAQGGNVIPPPLTDSLFSHIVEHSLKGGNGRLNDGVKMTKREREIIALIADALSNKEIAQRLNIGTYTVKSHVHNILEKLALHSRLQIAQLTQYEEESAAG